MFLAMSASQSRHIVATVCFLAIGVSFLAACASEGFSIEGDRGQSSGDECPYLRNEEVIGIDGLPEVPTASFLDLPSRKECAWQGPGGELVGIVVGPPYEESLSELAEYGGFENNDLGSFGPYDYVHSYDESGYNSIVVDLEDFALTLTVTTGDPAVSLDLARRATERAQ